MNNPTFELIKELFENEGIYVTSISVDYAHDYIRVEGRSFRTDLLINVPVEVLADGPIALRYIQDTRMTVDHAMNRVITEVNARIPKWALTSLNSKEVYDIEFDKEMNKILSGEQV